MRIVGNLDVEVTWARMDAAARRARGEMAPSPEDPRFALPETVMRKISAAATLLRVFAESDDDVLWTPRPVDPSRMARVEWLPAPRLESGPVPESADVWWGETTDEAALANHRASLQDVRVGALGCPRSAIVRSVGDLEAHVAEGGPWVAKSPHSAAGRLRVLGRGAGIDHRERVQAQRLLDLYGCLLFEPWFERVADFGTATVRHERGVSLAWPHGLLVDAAGRFLGIESPAANVSKAELAAIQHALECASDWLKALDYLGPWGADLFRARGSDGATRLHLSEVNARMTFGLVARKAMRRCRSSLNLSEDAPLALRFGRGAPPSDAIPLLLPGPDDDTCAWLETPLRHGA